VGAGSTAREVGGGDGVLIEGGRRGADEFGEAAAVDLSGDGPEAVPGAVTDDGVRAADVPGASDENLQALHAVAGDVVTPDELDELLGPHGPAVTRGQGREQRTRTIARHRSPPPAHVL
jgi:hypothetical protein